MPPAPEGQASSPGTDDGGIRQRSHGIPGQAPPSHGRRTSRKLRLRWTPRPVPGLQSRPSSCCTLGMRGGPGCLPPCLQPEMLWGLEDLELRVMEDTDNDSALMLRQMYLTLLAYKGLGQLTVPQVGSSWSTRWTR